MCFDWATMGGDRCRIELDSCGDIQRKEKIWNILCHGNFTPFLERLHVHNPNASAKFFTFWHNRKLVMKELEVDVNKDLISTITGIPTMGRNFFKDKKSNEE